MRVSLSAFLAGVFLFTSPLRPKPVQTSAKSPVGAWMAGAGQLTIDKDGKYYQQAPISGGYPCRGLWEQKGQVITLFLQVCAASPGETFTSDAYPPYSKKPSLYCRIEETPADIYSLEYLVCANGKTRYQSMDHQVPPGSVRMLQGISVVRQVGFAHLSAPVPFVSSPSENGKPVLLDTFDISNGSNQRRSILAVGELVQCIAMSEKEFEIKGVRGHWYFLGGINMYPSFGTYQYAGVFLSAPLVCELSDS